MTGVPASASEFIDLVRKSGVADDQRLDAHLQKLTSAGRWPTEAAQAAGVLIRDGFLTQFQAENILQGRWRRFTIGKYKVLEKIGAGGMGQVYLCEHKLMRRRVAVKVLPTAKAADDAARERFYREARAVAALDHPNIVHAYDIDQDENLHFLVMEYVDGTSLQDIVNKAGPLALSRACHYIRQAALGLEHAHEAGLVHRDIKPGNIMLDRSGVVKILDMGLARFFNDEDDLLTKKYDDNNMGTLDYQSPEQAIDSHNVDIRADIYSLGATFFFVLTGNTPFGDGTVAQKALRHQQSQPRRIAEFRADIPPAIQALIDKMLAKNPEERYRVPGEVAQALEPFTQADIAPPADSEMPRLSRAASGAGTQDSAQAATKISAPAERKATSSPPSPSPGAAKRPGPDRIAAVATPPTPNPRPRTAAEPVRTQQAVELEPDLEQEPVHSPWDIFAPDTREMNAQGDTAPQTVRTPRPPRGAELARLKEKRRLQRVVLTLSFGLLAVVGVLLWLFVFSGAGGLSPGTRAPLSVSRDGTKAFKTIRQALQAALAGDVIEIHDVVHEENLIVDGRGADVTIQAARGLEIRWGPAKKDEKSPLIYIAKAPGFRIHGKRITLDGMIDPTHRLRDIVFITSVSPGLVIEDLHFVNIGQCAVKIMNAQGSHDQFIRLRNLSGQGGKGAVGVALDASPDIAPSVNDFIEIGEFRSVAIPAQAKNSAVLGKNVIRPD